MTRIGLVKTLLVLLAISGPFAATARAADDKTVVEGKREAAGPPFIRKADVIYGRKFGVALTLDVFTPKKDANGAAAIYVVSGGWYSGHDPLDDPAGPAFVNALVERGYTVFGVVHGSQPKFTIPEILQDMNRAVRFVRHHAGDYQVDPNRIGIYGGSAGGHLSLMQGVAGDTGDPKAKDPIDRESSRVQAVACFFPPTDFLNYGKEGENALGRGILKDFKAPFDFTELDAKTRAFIPITDEQKVLEIGRNIGPINHVTPDDAPTLIIHGDADKLVPIQQAEIFVKKMKEAGVPARLVVKPGAGHGWPNMQLDLPTLADWFDKHLKKIASAASASRAATGARTSPSAQADRPGAQRRRFRTDAEFFA
jgi:acetyl esterase/lipase